MSNEEKKKEVAEKIEILAGFLNQCVQESQDFEDYCVVMNFRGKRKGDQVEIKNFKYEVGIVETKKGGHFMTACCSQMFHGDVPETDGKCNNCGAHYTGHREVKDG